MKRHTMASLAKLDIKPIKVNRLKRGERYIIYYHTVPTVYQQHLISQNLANFEDYYRSRMNYRWIRSYTKKWCRQYLTTLQAEHFIQVKDAVLYNLDLAQPQTLATADYVQYWNYAAQNENSMKTLQTYREMMDSKVGYIRRPRDVGRVPPLLSSDRPPTRRLCGCCL